MNSTITTHAHSNKSCSIGTYCRYICLITHIFQGNRATTIGTTHNATNKGIATNTAIGIQDNIGDVGTIGNNTKESYLILVWGTDSEMTYIVTLTIKMPCILTVHRAYW